jgi:predicted dehydrogenase
LGEFESLSAALPMVSAREEAAEDTYIVRFKLANGIEGILQQTAGAWGEGANMTRVAGTQGTVWIEGSTVKIADRNGTRDLPVPSDLMLPSLSSEDPAAARRLPAALGPYTRLCEALLAAMEGRVAGAGAAGAANGAVANAAVPVPTFADGVACMEVLDAIRQSAANGGGLVTVR